MPLVTMDMMMSSVLREANKSLMPNQSWTSAKTEDNHFQERNISGHHNSTNPDHNIAHSNQASHLTTPNLLISSQDSGAVNGDMYAMYESVNGKQEILDTSMTFSKSNAMSSQSAGRPHSSPPGSSADMNCPTILSYTDGDIFQPMDGLPVDCSRIASLIAAQHAHLSPASSEAHMDIGLQDFRYNLSRTCSPTPTNNSTPTSGEFMSQHKHLNEGESLFGERLQADRYLGRSKNFEEFYTPDYLGQEDHVPDIHLNSDQHENVTYVHNYHQQEGSLWQLKANPALRREVIMHDMHSLSNSLDSFDLITDNNSSKYEDSDYSNASTDYSTGRYSSATPHTNQHTRSNKFDNSKYQSISKPSSISTSTPSPSSLSQSASDNVQTSIADVEYNADNDHNNRQEGAYEVKSNKVKDKGGFKPRGAQNLPPCRVCGNMASGLHFGVNTCEACNEFFRRSLKRGASYYCSKNRECQVYGKKRNACSFCRYQRCVEMGMSRDAIKTGRYSHKTRTEYAMEVEKVKLREVNRVEMEKYHVLLCDLVKYHDKYVKVTTRIPDEELEKNQTAYLQLYHTEKEHEQRHPPLKTANQNKRLLDDWTMVKEDLSLTMHDAEMTEQWLRNYINYAKNVPGFKELALSDQASLVRGSWFEFWFLGAFRGYNNNLQVVAYPNGRCFHRQEINKVFGQEYTDFSFYLADRMRSLDVTPEVMVLIKTVCLTFPDRTPLDNKAAVDKMHWSMVTCLLHTLENIQSGGTASFPLVVSKLVELRTLTDIAMRAHKSALFQDVLKESPLLCEMVDTKTRYVQCVHKNSIPVTGDS